jgi:hypothetical protein
MRSSKNKSKMGASAGASIGASLGGKVGPFGAGLGGGLGGAAGYIAGSLVPDCGGKKLLSDGGQPVDSDHGQHDSDERDDGVMIPVTEA